MNARRRFERWWDGLTYRDRDAAVVGGVLIVLGGLGALAALWIND
jgi:hypothetical protein